MQQRDAAAQAKRRRALGRLPFAVKTWFSRLRFRYAGTCFQAPKLRGFLASLVF
jgi:hypothetical protein